MFKVIQNANPEKVKEFQTVEEAQEFIKKTKKAKNFYRIEEVKAEPEVIKKTLEKKAKESKAKREKKVKEPKVSWKDSVDFSGAVEITRENVKNFYKKAGYIKVIDRASGNVLHIGRTKNMGKVFSNYVNCAKYNQVYDFHIETTDALFFKESEEVK